jgi:hypothetical protein
MLYLAMEDSGGRVGKGRGDRHPAGNRAVHPGWRDHAGQAAARAAAGPVRLHRPPDFYEAGELEVIRRSASLLGVTLSDDGAKEIATGRGDTADRQPAAAPGA